ncbi:MAG TPA: hypothetical protein VIG47_10095 [Gemmatimonadaceae bacterium]
MVEDPFEDVPSVTGLRKRSKVGKEQIVPWEFHPQLRSVRIGFDRHSDNFCGMKESVNGELDGIDRGLVELG